jgi:hypothetical protein
MVIGGIARLTTNDLQLFEFVSSGASWLETGLGLVPEPPIARLCERVFVCIFLSGFLGWLGIAALCRTLSLS